MGSVHPVAERTRSTRWMPRPRLPGRAGGGRPPRRARPPGCRARRHRATEPGSGRPRGIPVPGGRTCCASGGPVFAVRRLPSPARAGDHVVGHRRLGGPCRLVSGAAKADALAHIRRETSPVAAPGAPCGGVRETLAGDGGSALPGAQDPAEDIG
ncbi:hypothetical protein QJS66_02910 [Kocuria rhizophila]|nr:hypothetical protein QJS66_02910 [Kocuria rhizophila]